MKLTFKGREMTYKEEFEFDELLISFFRSEISNDELVKLIALTLDSENNHNAAVFMRDFYSAYNNGR